ncbi:MAG TPA: GNAT family N-acetyltransferase [Clostridia bacterium]|nr:GNAT family N-acetyltransferase [Clostridia bacterium]
MEIRPIKPEEKIMTEKIESIAFLFKKDFNAVQNNGKESDDLSKGSEEKADAYKTGRAAFDENGKMCSCLQLMPFEVQFDGSIVPMGGIGGVASLPEEREKSSIRSIFEHSMQEMYEKGYVFSFLYPFSHPFYRKFGYELNMTPVSYNIPLADFKHFTQSGRLKMYTKDMDSSDIKSVYNEYIKDKNLAVIRTGKLWDMFLEKDPYKDNVYLYIWYDKIGKARGYIQFSANPAYESKCNMLVSELIWLDREALSGIFAFIGKLTAQMDRMIWRAPSFLNLLPLFPEPYDIKQEKLTRGMNRIVNVEKALGLMSVPEGAGEVVIGVEDSFFPVNSDSYRVEWDNGRLSADRTNAEPDMLCDVQALSQLVTGFLSVEELKLAGRLDIKRNEKLLVKVFPKKKLFISNYF